MDHFERLLVWVLLITTIFLIVIIKDTNNKLTELEIELDKVKIQSRLQYWDIWIRGYNQAEKDAALRRKNFNEY